MAKRGRPKKADADAAQKIWRNIEEIYKKYRNSTYVKYTKGVSEKTISKVPDDMLKTGADWFHKYAVELECFLYETDEIFNYSEKEQDAYGDVMVEFKEWEYLYKEEARKRRLVRKGYKLDEM